MEPRPYRQRYYAVIGFVALGFAAFRVMNGDYGIAVALALVAAFLLVVAARDPS